MFAEVAVPLPINKTFHYLIPERLRDSVAPGKRVLVPFGPRKITGYILGFPERPEVEELKELEDVLDEEPIFSPRMLDFYRWASSYYLHPLGEVLKAATPEGIDVKSVRVASLTEEGRKALVRGQGSEGERKVLERLSQSGEVSLKTLRRVTKRKTLERLESQGLIAIRSQVVGARVRPLTLTLYRAVGSPPEGFERRAPKQAKILALLRTEGLATLERLKEEEKGADVILRELLKRGLVERVEEARPRLPSMPVREEPVLALTQEQEKALREVTSSIASGSFSPFLLHGVTGSGKTEVYLLTIQEVLSRGKGVIFLLPEISLSYHLYSRIKGRFGEQVALLHSGLSLGERFDMWNLLKRGRARIAVGARSAIFAPVENLGLIIVDEEHAETYKQEEGFRYQARDLALMRGKMDNAVVILGSATPAIESFHNSLQGKSRLLTLMRRVEERPLPKVEIIDMREVERDLGRPASLSPYLHSAIERNLAEGGQAILFLNRRGEATFVLCPDCGYSYRCPFCSVALILHQARSVLRCHYCNYSTAVPERCPHCQGARIRGFGLGTEKLERQVIKAFPGAKVARLDSDVASKRGAAERVLSDFEAGSLDILVGTQMVAKGLDFPGVTLVGVVSADTSLNLPDFRAAERTFQLLTQVAGRAGRGRAPGRVIIQTYNPEHYSIRWASSHDYSGFYRQEVRFRKELSYPPFSRLIKLELKGGREGKVKRSAQVVRDVAVKILGNRAGISILGPAPAPLYRIKGEYRFQIMIRGRSPSSLHKFMEELLRQVEPIKPLIVDVDPYSML